MAILLSHTSALQCYRTSLFDDAESSARKPLRRTQAERALANAKPKSDGIANAAALCHDEPIHLLIPSESERSRSSRVICHIAPGQLPLQAFLPAENNVFASSPALLIEQLALKLPFTQTIALAWELCGDYRLGSSRDRTFRPRPSLGDPDDFSSALQNRPRARGLETALTALRCTCAHSASPMETMVGLQLSLPRCYGGFGLPKPRMNHRIEIPSGARATTGKSFLVADLFWPEYNLCVEYQSTQFHTGAERIDSDARRRTALEDLGITIVEVTASQALSKSSMNEVAHVLAKKMRKRIRTESKWEAKHELMWTHLLEWHGFTR